MGSPLVSILIPAYNRENFIASCIESALSQTYSELEIIIVDNASVDNTWNICRQYAAADRRVKIFRNGRNLGPVMNWLRCIAEARGAYGKLLFSDDLILPCFLEHTVGHLDDPEVGFVATSVLVGATMQESSSHTSSHSGRITRDIYLEKLVARNFPFSPGAALFRMDDLRKNLQTTFPTRVGRDFAANGAGPDVMLYALTALDYKYVVFLRNPDVFFRVHADSLTIANLNNIVQENYVAAIAWLCRAKLSKSIWAEHVARSWISDVKRNRRLRSVREYCVALEGEGTPSELLMIARKVIKVMSNRVISRW